MIEVEDRTCCRISSWDRFLDADMLLDDLIDGLIRVRHSHLAVSYLGWLAGAVALQCEDLFTGCLELC